ncbi:hypothetical protein ABTC39_19745, partial [Acinetobacter baumannii]
TSYGNTVQAGVLPPASGYAAGPVPYVTPYTTPYAVPAYPYGYWGPGWGYYGAPSVSFGIGVYRGWGYRPWYYGRPHYHRSWGGWRRR